MTACSTWSTLRILRLEVLAFLPRLASSAPLPANYPKIRQGHCKRVKLSHSPLIAHVDGELFCVHKDGTSELDIEIVPRALPVAGLPLL